MCICHDTHQSLQESCQWAYLVLYQVCFPAETFWADITDIFFGRGGGGGGGYFFPCIIFTTGFFTMSHYVGEFVECLSACWTACPFSAQFMTFVVEICSAWDPWRQKHRNWSTIMGRSSMEPWCALDKLGHRHNSHSVDWKMSFPLIFINEKLDRPFFRFWGVDVWVKNGLLIIFKSMIWADWGHILPPFLCSVLLLSYYIWEQLVHKAWLLVSWLHFKGFKVMDKKSRAFLTENQLTLKNVFKSTRRAITY